MMMTQKLPLVVSEIEIIPVKPRQGLVAFASCVINDHLYLGNIGIHTRPDGSGYRLVFPLKVLPNGKSIQCFHPITREAGNLILRAVSEKLEALIGSVRCDEDVSKTLRQHEGVPNGANPT